jgi:ribose 5-phosphate isomerase
MKIEIIGVGNGMNVKKLIELLQEVKDKEKIVKLSVNDVVTSNFHLNDNLSTRLYLSNAQEEGYKTTPLD